MKQISTQRPLELEVLNQIKGTYLVRYGFNEIKEEENSHWEFEEVLFNKKPELSEIKTLIIDYYNKLCDYEISSGFVYEDMPVWLSTENQMNYKAAYDIQVQTNGVTLKERPLKFKFGTNDNPQYKVFDNLENLSDFYLNALYYIQTTLEKYWDIKDEINWSKYEIKTEE